MLCRHTGSRCAVLGIATLLGVAFAGCLQDRDESATVAPAEHSLAIHQTITPEPAGRAHMSADTPSSSKAAASSRATEPPAP